MGAILKVLVDDDRKGELCTAHGDVQAILVLREPGLLGPDTGEDDVVAFLPLHGVDRGHMELLEFRVRVLAGQLLNESSLCGVEGDDNNGLNLCSFLQQGPGGGQDFLSLREIVV